MAAFRYAYKVEGLQKTSAQIAGEVMEQLEQTEEGLTPQSLVDASRAEDAPLHDEFEWDDDVAAEEYRKVQARKLIQNVVILAAEKSEEKPAETTRAYVSAPGRESRYIPVRTALSDKVFKAHLLMMAKREAAQFAAKYRAVKELCSVIDAIDKFLTED